MLSMILGGRECKNNVVVIVVEFPVRENVYEVRMLFFAIPKPSE